MDLVWALYSLVHFGSKSCFVHAVLTNKHSLEDGICPESNPQVDTWMSESESAWVAFKERIVSACATKIALTRCNCCIDRW